MRVVFMGTPDLSVGTLEALINNGHEVVGVVTQPDKPKGRGKELMMTPVKAKAVEHNIPVFQPVKVRKNEEFMATLRELAPDVIVVVAFGQILPKEVLELPKYGCVNVHTSLLPMYRGAAPIQWVIINGETESGVTTMLMDTGIDTGDMLLKQVVPIDKKETYGSYHDKLSAAGAKLLIETLNGLLAGTITPVKQEGETSYVSIIDKSMGNIDWNKSAVEIERLIRGLNPWPSAYTYLDGKTLKLWDADVCESEDTALEAGTVINITKDSFSVVTGDGLLKINELQIEGKKRMDTGSFLRGYKLNEGVVLK